jgi:hypothetical protein
MYYSIFMVYFNVFIIYFNAFIVCFNVFYYISMCLNVFIDIIIGILPSHSHCNVLPCTPTYTFFFHSTQWFLSQHAIPLHYFFSISIDLFQLSYNLWKYLQINPYFTSIHHPTFHVPHSRFHVVTSCAEHSKAQVCFTITHNCLFELKLQINHLCPIFWILSKPDIVEKNNLGNIIGLMKHLLKWILGF